MTDTVKSETFIPHSIPVPDLYRCGKNVLRQHMEGKGTIKKLVFEGKFRNYQRLFAVVQKAVGKYDEIQKVLTELGIFANHPQLDPYLATILASEIVERGYDLPGKCKPVLAMNNYKPQLIKKLQKIGLFKEKDVLPTYVRINTLKATPEQIHKELQNLGFYLLDHDWSKLTYEQFLDTVQALGRNTYVKDYHIPDLLVFPPRQPFWNTQIFSQSLIIVQDKASCMPVFLSGVHPGMNVIDACAAPGNKSTHLASKMRNEGSLVAVEKDVKRFGTLEKLIDERGATFIATINADFRHIDMELYKDTNLILVDPSCSSSGTSVHNQEVSSKRVENLSFFQSRILKHALSFPSVRTVLYSTCSVNEQENEAVVDDALKCFGHIFKLAKLNKKLKGWKHFGSPNYDCGKYCLRTDPKVDKCHGFFIAKFKRSKHQIICEADKNSTAEFSHSKYTSEQVHNKTNECNQGNEKEMCKEVGSSSDISEEFINSEKMKRKHSLMVSEIDESTENKLMKHRKNLHCDTKNETEALNDDCEIEIDNNNYLKPPDKNLNSSSNYETNISENIMQSSKKKKRRKSQLVQESGK